MKVQLGRENCSDYVLTTRHSAVLSSACLHSNGRDSKTCLIYWATFQESMRNFTTSLMSNKSWLYVPHKFHHGCIFSGKLSIRIYLCVNSKPNQADERISDCNPYNAVRSVVLGACTRLCVCACALSELVPQ